MFNGSKLRDAREKAGLSRVELGAIADVSETTIYEWEARGKGPRTLCKLAEALGVSAAVFFDSVSQKTDQAAS